MVDVVQAWCKVSGMLIRLTRDAKRNVIARWLVFAYASRQLLLHWDWILKR
jgi:hypothetical protein